MKGLIGKMRSSMSAKIALIVTLPVVIITSFFEYNGYRYEKQILLRNVEMQILRVAEGLKWPAETTLITNSFGELQAVVVETAKGADIDLIAVYDHQGNVLASNKIKWIGRNMLAMIPEDITGNDKTAIRKALAGGYSIYYDPDDQQYCFAMPLSIAGRGAYALHINMDMYTSNSETKKSAIKAVLVSISLSLVIGLSIFYLFRHHFTKRIRAVSSSAIRLASGDLNSGANVSGTDEIQQLASSFNVLAKEISGWRANLENMVVQRVKELSILYEVVDSISKSLELGKVLSSVLDRVLENMGERMGVVVLVGAEGEALKIMGQRGLTAESVSEISTRGVGGAADAILKNRPLRTTSEDEDELKNMTGLSQGNVLSALVAPIVSMGCALGAIAVYSEEKDKFTEQDEALLATIGSQVGVAVENARLYEKTLELANMDGLTGLSTRRFLMETLRKEIDRSVRYTAPLSLLLLDLDKFKSFNDTYGHPKGDELLREFGSLVQRKIRTSDMAGRYGGEEFAVILPNTPLKGAIVTAERIRKSFEAVRIPVADGSSQAGTTVSIGIAELSPGETEEKLIAAADAALYRAKEGGRNGTAW